LDRISVRVDPDLADLIPGYLDNRRQDIALIQQALGRQDFATIRTAGHKMKGSGGGYGFDEITDIGRAIEEAANIEHGEEILRQVEALKSYLERLEVFYQA
jgi:HPt (histidine-containing phosphotransfer) domain-containing protein